MTGGPQPRIFMLGNGGWEESPEFYERAGGEPLSDPRWAAKTTEVAPGVRVAPLSTGGRVGPEGQIFYGARIAVWRADGPLLSDSERWQVEEARQMVARWDQRHGNDIYGTDRALADAARGLLAIVDQIAPAVSGEGD
jgi:hypothetical protein